MKGLIHSGGKGTRLRPLTYASAKQLGPVALVRSRGATLRIHRVPVKPAACLVLGDNSEVGIRW